MSENTFAPVSPFDDTNIEGFQIYDNVKYVRDIELIDESSIRQHSPYMIKYYTTVSNDAVKIGGD